MIHISDSVIYGDIWASSEMKAIFTEESRLQGWLEVIAALAEAQEELDIIPAGAGSGIRAACRYDLVDWERVRRDYCLSGHSLMGIIRELQRLAGEPAGEWVCYGVTVQDVTDTWMSVALQRAWEIVDADLRDVSAILLELARVHRDTPMAGRTHGQEGLPITFGFKAAVWFAEVRRHLARLASLRERLGEGQLCGGVGSLSSFGDRGFALQERFMAKLGLRPPVISWINSRDVLVEYLYVLTMIGNTCDKMAHEVYNLQRSEIGELAEGREFGQIGSITMPHKRNPELAEHIGVLARQVRQGAHACSENMVWDHERDGRAWKSEWAWLPAIFVQMGALLQHTRRLFTGLEVNRERMLENLERTGGRVCSEAVMLGLARKIGKQKAHELVYRVAVEAEKRGCSFAEALRRDESVGEQLTEAELEELLRPERAAGLCGAFVERVLAEGGR